MTLAENLRIKYGVTSLKLNGNCLPLVAINEALEAAAKIAALGDAPAIANQIRALKWQAQTPFSPPKFASRDVA